MYLSKTVNTHMHLYTHGKCTYIDTHRHIYMTINLFVYSVVLLLSNQIFILLPPKEREAAAKRQRETEVVNIWLLCF